MNLDHSIFRAYDIRGVAYEQLSLELTYHLGRALGTMAQRKGFKEFVVARDVRLSGPDLMEQLQKGLLQSGCDVIDVGIVPSPVLYFANYEYDVACGIMLTASHNPAPDNGLKSIINFKALTASEIQELSQMIQKEDYAEGSGTLISRDDILERYFARIVGDIKLKKKLKVVIDCGNSVTGLTAPILYKQLGCDVVELFCDIDGNFPNHHPDPSVEKNLQDIIAAVKEHQADIGLAFDGDGDRIGVIDSEGNILWPDRQIIVFAQDVLQRNPGAEIIYDVKCTRWLAESVIKAGGKPTMWKTGHSFIKSKMNESGAPMAGEMSGHIFFKERWYGFDDGVYAGARMLEIVSGFDGSSAEMFAAIPNSVNTPELKLPVEESKKFALVEKLVAAADFKEAELITIDGIRVNFVNGWGLLRASNTSPYLILRFEADDQQSLEAIQESFRQLLLGVDSSLELPF